MEVELFMNFLPLAPSGLIVSVIGGFIAKKNDLKSVTCVIGLVISALSTILFLLLVL